MGQLHDEFGACISASPCLLLLSRSSTLPAAHDATFSTQHGDMQTVSCSGVVITCSLGSSNGSCFVLAPLSIFQDCWSNGDNGEPGQVQQQAGFLNLAAGCRATVLARLGGDEYSAWSCNGPAMLVPVQPATEALQQLSQSVGRASADWGFSWVIGSRVLTPLEQASLVLCHLRRLEDQGPGDTPRPQGRAPSDAAIEIPPTPGSQLTSALQRLRAALSTSGATLTHAPAASACAHCTKAAAPQQPPSLSGMQALQLSGAPPHTHCDAPCPGGGSTSCAISSTCCGCADACAAGEAAGLRPGSPVAVWGSPFGCLAPYHFIDACIRGVVSLQLHTHQHVQGQHAQRLQQHHQQVQAGRQQQQLQAAAALYALDAHVYPGMEGAPVVAEHAVTGSSMCCYCHGGGGGGAPCQALVGMLATPLTRRADGAQIPLMLAWPAVRAALLHALCRCAAEASKRQASDAGAGAAGDVPALQLQLLSGSAGPAAAAAQAAAVCLRCGGRQRAVACICGRPAPAFGLPPPSPPLEALQAVVLLKWGSSWASGVIISHDGIILTVAHLVDRQRGQRGGGGGRPPAVQLPPPPSAGILCDVRLSGPSAGHASGHRWARARLLHAFAHHLDLAVFQLEDPDLDPDLVSNPAGHDRVPMGPHAGLAAGPLYGATDASGDRGGDKLCAVTAAVGAQAGKAVWAAGHSLMGPAAAWPAAVSFGNIAKVVVSPTAGQPQPQPQQGRNHHQHHQQQGRSSGATMLIATTATHAGGSGGALLTASGRLAGLVTSNARHMGRTTLPHLAFCIAGEELRAVVEWAAQRPRKVPRGAGGGAGAEEQGGEGEGEAERAWLARLRGLDVEDANAARIWQLQVPSEEAAATAPTSGVQQQRQRQQQHLAGAAAGARLSRL